MKERKTILIDHNESKYAFMDKQSVILKVQDKISGEEFLVRSSNSYTTFYSDRIRRKTDIVYNVSYYRTYVNHIYNKKEQLVVYDRARRLTKKQIKKIRTENPEFFI